MAKVNFTEDELRKALANNPDLDFNGDLESESPVEETVAIPPIEYAPRPITLVSFDGYRVPEYVLPVATTPRRDSWLSVIGRAYPPHVWVLLALLAFFFWREPLWGLGLWVALVHLTPFFKTGE